jgi:alanine racemase
MAVQELTITRPEPISAEEQPVRRFIAPAWLEVDLDKVASNVRKLKALAGPGVKLLAMVKAQGYGCGAEMIARVALENGAEMLGVASVQEGLSLRRCGLECPILVFGRPDEAELKGVVEEDFSQTLFDLALARRLDCLCQRYSKKIRVHLKIDTGMGRLGLLPREIESFLEGFGRCTNLVLEGVYTHFAVADSDREYTQRQVELFQGVLWKIREKGYEVPLVHVENSAALLNGCCEQFDMVRTGIGIHGTYGSPLVTREVQLEEAMSFKARVCYLKRIPAGANVSYGRRFIASEDTTIATISAGYADGVPFQLANKGHVLIRGRRFPIVGRVTMDMTMASLGNSDDVRIGDDAVIIGQSGEDRISVAEVAEKAGTIEYQVMCGIGPRVPRLYMRNGQVFAVHRYTFRPTEENGQLSEF